jgi:hypothetical protein
MVDRAELEAEKRAAQIDNLIKAWAALRLIYEAVGQHAPPGTLPSEETLVTPLDYAEHIVQGIEAIIAGKDRASDS